MQNNHQRLGVTPAVAIILLLLIGMALIGAMYAWMTGFQGALQEDAEQQFQTNIEVRDLRCHLQPGDDSIRFVLSNSGSRNVPAGNVDVWVYDSQRELVKEETGLDWSGNAFTEPGNTDRVDVPVSDFQKDAFYSITVAFSDAGIEMDAGSCMPERFTGTQAGTEDGPIVAGDYADDNWYTEPQDVEITCSGQNSPCEQIAWEIYDGDGDKVRDDIVSGDTTTVSVGEEADGALELWYQGTDSSGNSGFWNSTLVKVDKTPPHTYLADEGHWYSATFTKTVEDGDSDSGIASCTYRVDDGGSGWTTWKDRTCDEVTVTVGSDAECSVQGADRCKVQVNVTSNSGHTETDTAVFNIDYEPPQPTITGPDPSQTYNDDFTVTVADSSEIAGYQQCSYRINDGGAGWTPWQSRDCPDGDFNVTVGNKADCTTEGNNACRVEARATDTAGLSQSDTEAYNISLSTGGTGGTGDGSGDGTPPTTEDDYDKTGWQSDPQDVTITCTDADPGCDHIDWEIYDGSDNLQNSGTGNGDQVTVTVGDDEPDGALELWYRGVDGDGNTEVWNYTTVKIDTNPPHIQLLANDTWFNNTFTMPVDEGDVGPSGISQCDYRVDDAGSGWTAWSVRTCGEVTVTVGDGEECSTDGRDSCTVQVRLSNNAGQSENDTESFNIDTQQPTTTITGPDASQNYSDSFAITVDDQDNGALDTCEYRVKDGDAAWTGWQSRTCNQDITIDVGENTGDCTTQGYDACQVETKVTDGAGYQDTAMETYSIAFEQMTGAIDTTIVGPDTGYTFGEDFTVTVDDQGDGVDTCEYQIDSGAWQSRSCPDGTFTVDINNACSSSSCAVTARVTDADGNSNSSQQTYTVDTTMAEVVFEQDEITPLYNTPSNLTWGQNHTFHADTLTVYDRTLGIGDRFNLSVYGDSDQDVESTVWDHAFTTFTYGTPILTLETTASGTVQFEFTGATMLANGTYVLYKDGTQQQELSGDGTLTWQDGSLSTPANFTVVPERN